jgi:hypothetical protein
LLISTWWIYWINQLWFDESFHSDLEQQLAIQTINMLVHDHRERQPCIQKHLITSANKQAYQRMSMKVMQTWHFPNMTVKGMFYPLLARFKRGIHCFLLNLKAAFRMGVRDTKIGCIWVKWRKHLFSPSSISFEANLSYLRANPYIFEGESIYFWGEPIYFWGEPIYFWGERHFKWFLSIL